MEPNPTDALLGSRLAQLDAQGQLRARDQDLRAAAAAAARAIGRAVLDLSSNDYLGFAEHPLPPTGQTPGGAGASRLIHGTRGAHRAAEAALAEWVGQPDALLFASGYAANIGLISALAMPGDVVLSDELNHASLIDGCRLSKADVRTFPHKALSSVERMLEEARGRNTWVVTESYFSMDGTVPDLAALNALVSASSTAALLVDEAHALGVFGPAGAGLCAAAHVRPAATVGTFGKSLGLHGAFVAGSQAVCDWVWNRARSFVYSTATSPAMAQAVPERIRDVASAEVVRTRLHNLCATFHVKLRSAFPVHYPPDTAVGPIVPLLVGSEWAALSARDLLVSRGILTQAIRPPTVPRGASRLRLSLHADLSDQDLDYVLEQLEAALALSSGARP